MKQEYQAWIDQYMKEHKGNVAACCGHACKMMSQEFPELIRVPGTVLLIHPDGLKSGGGEHWWCRLPNGKIIDPTKSQFLPFLICEYHPWPKWRPIPTGKCPNCGDLAYNHEYFCSSECALSYTKYVESFR